MKNGLKLFGTASAEAVVRNMKQFHDQKFMEPKKADILTTEEKKGPLIPHVLEKEEMWKDQGSEMFRK